MQQKEQIFFNKNRVSKLADLKKKPKKLKKTKKLQNPTNKAYPGALT
jgi:ribosomal protein L24E